MLRRHPGCHSVRLQADQIQNTHQQVKTKILERMGEWSEMFKKNPDLGIMEQAYMKLKSQSTTPPVSVGQ